MANRAFESLSDKITERLADYKVDEENWNRKAKKDAIESERLIFSRVLGHFEIPRSHKWIEANECWLCEKHSNTV